MGISDVEGGGVKLYIVCVYFGKLSGKGGIGVCE